MTYKQLTVLIPSHGLEDLQTDLAEKPAASMLNAFAVLWHPQLITSSGQIPNWFRADAPQSDETEKLIIVPESCEDLVPPGWVDRTREEGGIVVIGEIEREKMLAQALAPLESTNDLDPELVADFLAFGTVYLLLELLTRNMRNFSNIDELHLRRVMVSAAEAAVNQDSEAARKHLTACYEMLLESRERFYPVECFLIDLCLITPEVADDSLSKLLLSPTPVNLHAPALEWQKIIEQEPQWKDRVRSALQQETLEIIGGDDVELVNSLMSLDDTLWHLQQGHRLFQEFFDVRPVTWARKRYGLGPHLPQLLKRLGYIGALHVVLDDGNYPDEEQSQVRWEGSDGSTLNAISRIPLAADGASGIFRFPERMSESMDSDHVAAVMFARWPDMKTPYLDDLRRAHRYAPVLGKFVRFEEYFQHASGPARRSSHRAGEYLSPALIHAAAAQDPDPVGRFVTYWERQRAFERADWSRQMSRLLANQFGPDAEAEAFETTVREAHPEADAATQTAADQTIENVLSSATEQLQKQLAQAGTAGPGVLVMNPLSFPRKALIEWPAGTVPVSHPNIIGMQIESNRAWAVVNLPPCGFVWLASNNHPGSNTPTGKLPLAEDLLLRTDQFEVRLSDVTGGIAGIQTYRRSPNRISQQVALRFPQEKLVTTGEGEERETHLTYYTSMQLRESRILSQGPLVGEIETLGDLLDENTGDVVATYRQRTRVIRGRPLVEVDLEIAPVEVPQGNPWMNYIGCRFAWRHIEVALTGSMQQGAQTILKERIEAPHYLEIADDDFRTTLLTPGLTFHRKTGERMLDSIFIAEADSARNFRFSIAVDSKYPMQACLDQFSPPIVLPTQTQPAEGSSVGWFFGLSAANVQLTRILPSITPHSIVVRLLETEGRGRVIGLQCFRTPTAARLIDFHGETITKLQTDDAVNIEISPYGICDVELTF